MTESLPLSSTVAIIPCFISRKVFQIFLCLGLLYMKLMSFRYFPLSVTFYMKYFKFYTLFSMIFTCYFHSGFQVGTLKFLSRNCMFFLLRTHKTTFLQFFFLVFLHDTIDKFDNDQTTLSSAQVWWLSWFSCISFKIIAF